MGYLIFLFKPILKTLSKVSYLPTLSFPYTQSNKIILGQKIPTLYFCKLAKWLAKNLKSLYTKKYTNHCILIFIIYLLKAWLDMIDSTNFILATIKPKTNGHGRKKILHNFGELTKSKEWKSITLVRYCFIYSVTTREKEIKKRGRGM